MKPTSRGTKLSNKDKDVARIIKMNPKSKGVYKLSSAD
jgi:hypothetical protein